MCLTILTEMFWNVLCFEFFCGKIAIHISTLQSGLAYISCGLRPGRLAGNPQPNSNEFCVLGVRSFDTSKVSPQPTDVSLG